MFAAAAIPVPCSLFPVPSSPDKSVLALLNRYYICLAYSLATPESLAAFATALATASLTLGSKGAGMM